MTAQTWLWLDTAAMLVGGLLILLVGRQRTGSEQSHTVWHGIVPIIAACSYFAMATGQGVVHFAHAAPPANRAFYFARYLDWSVTTPLLLLTLAGTAMHSGLRRHGMVGGLLAADIMMIVTALFFGATDTAWIKWSWFAVSCAAFLAVYYVIWVPMLAQNRSERAAVQVDYRRSAAILSVLWLIYPLLLAISEDGLSWISETAGVASFAVLDFVSKVVYGFWATRSTARLVDAEPGVRR